MHILPFQVELTIHFLVLFDQNSPFLICKFWFQLLMLEGALHFPIYIYIYLFKSLTYNNIFSWKKDVKIHYIRALFFPQKCKTKLKIKIKNKLTFSILFSNFSRIFKKSVAWFSFSLCSSTKKKKGHLTNSVNMFAYFLH